MKDERVLAQCNLFGILGAIPMLLELDPAARRLVKKKKISIGFAVKDGPRATLAFENGNAELTEGVEKCSIKLPFASCQKFNGMIDGTVTPIPTVGIWHAGFLLGPFKKLTDLLTKYLRPSPEDLADPVFFERSTTLMLHVIAGAIAEIGNHDKIGRFSASNIVNGTVKIGIGEELAVGIRVKEHQLTALHYAPEESLSEMIFDSFETARDLFDGKINAIAAVGLGNVRIAGMISQVDNINRILDRVALYLQ
ncbi:MAG: hypothetical protein IJX28_04825 [Clostridia bacterium]|nr:hypothetical protein [Clostridia bacterium]